MLQYSRKSGAMAGEPRTFLPLEFEGEFFPVNLPQNKICNQKVVFVRKKTSEKIRYKFDFAPSNSMGKSRFFLQWEVKIIK